MKIAKQNNVQGNPKQSLSYSGSSISVVSGYTPGEITLNLNGVIFPEYLRFQAQSTRLRPSSETQGRLAGTRGNKSGKEMKHRRSTSKAESISSPQRTVPGSPRMARS